MRRRSNRPVWTRLVGALALLIALGLGVDTTPLGLNLGTKSALAHGEATLTVSPTVVAPGSDITAKGEGVEAGETFSITLEGLTFQATLGTVTVGDDEDFHEEFTVPTDTPPGTYQVQATSAEGEVLTAELTVEAGAATAEAAAPAEPSAEPMQLDRRKSTGELAVIVAGLLLSAGLGLALVRVRAQS